MCTVALYATDGMPRFAASSSTVVYPGGGTMPSMSVTVSPASATASWATRSIISTGSSSAPRTYSVSAIPTIAAAPAKLLSIRPDATARFVGVQAWGTVWLLIGNLWWVT